MTKRPSFQFYPADWRNDPGLRLCSVAARGLWMDMLCLMHEGQPYGCLTVQGRSLDASALARLVGESPAMVKRWLKELADNDVYSVDDSGTIYSRRMVRDEDLRERRAEIGRANGVKGGAYGHLGAEHGKKGGRPRSENPGNKPAEKPPQNPRPSSSSPSSPSPSAGSSSASETVNRARQSSAPPEKLPAAVRAVMEAGGFVTPPPDLGLLDRWREAGADLDQDIVPVVRAVAKSVKDRTGRAPFKLQLFDQAIREKLASDAEEIERLRAIQRRYADQPQEPLQ